jgi:uncharacterized protein YuzE
MKIRITQDKQAGATYIHLREGMGDTFSHTNCCAGSVNVDMSTDGHVMGIEVWCELVESIVVDDITADPPIRVIDVTMTLPETVVVS